MLAEISVCTARHGAARPCSGIAERTFALRFFAALRRGALLFLLAAALIPALASAAQIVLVVNVANSSLGPVSPGMAVEIRVVSIVEKHLSWVPLMPVEGVTVEFAGKPAPFLEASDDGVTVQVPALTPGQSAKVVVRGPGVQANGMVEVRSSVPSVILLREYPSRRIYPLVRECKRPGSSGEPEPLRPGQTAQPGAGGTICLVFSGTGVPPPAIGVNSDNPRVILVGTHSQLEVRGARIPVQLEVLDYGLGSQEFVVHAPATLNGRTVVIRPGSFDLLFEGVVIPLNVAPGDGISLNGNR